MRLTTDAIDSSGRFDARYTCDIDNSSPELRWENPPQGTEGYAILAEDPDVHPGPFAHWVVYNIPVSVLHLPTGIPTQDSLPNGIRQGVNGFGKLGYAGPCPPRGSSGHQYVFRLFALSSLPELSSRLSRERLLAEITPYILAVTQVEGRYTRSVERAS